MSQSIDRTSRGHYAGSDMQLQDMRRNPMLGHVPPLDEMISPGMSPMLNISARSASDLNESLKEIGIGSGIAFVHPTGGFVKAGSLTEASMYLKAFGGVILIPRYPVAHDISIPSNMKMLAIEPDAIGLLTIDEAEEAYGLNMVETSDNPSFWAWPVIPESPLIQGVTEYLGNGLITKKYAMLDALPKLEQPKAAVTPFVNTNPNLYDAQAKVLNGLQTQDDGFHLLSGEVGVGKTHIAAEYINGIINENPNANILIIEPIDGVVERFRSLIDEDKRENVLITNDTKELRNMKWDLVVFDEFHKMDKNKDVSRYPLDTTHMATNVLAMTGTVSNTYPEQVWSVSKNYVSRYASEVGGSLINMSAMGPYNNAELPQMTSIRNQPKFFVEHLLAESSVQILRQDIEELGVAERMPVNKYSAGFDLTPTDRAFYNLIKGRAKSLGMSDANQLTILDTAFNTNQKDFVIQRSNVYGKNGQTKASFQLVNPDDVPNNAHDLLYLGRHDQPFRDKKIDFINTLSNDVGEKVLVYLTSNDYADRVVKDLEASGISAEFVNTSSKGAVEAINNSEADAVVFDVNPIMEGIDLHANHVVWYTTPTSAGLDEQACGRITRLSSEQTDKNFYYLYHKTTIQQDITERILKTNDVNNIALKRDSQITEEISLDLDDESLVGDRAL